MGLNPGLNWDYFRTKPAPPALIFTFRLTQLSRYRSLGCSLFLIRKYFFLSLQPETNTTLTNRVDGELWEEFVALTHVSERLQNLPFRIGPEEHGDLLQSDF